MIEKLTQYIDISILLNTVYGSQGYTPIIFAATICEVDFMKILIRAGGSVNVAEIDGWTPLMFAAHRGNPEICKVLLEAGADPFMKTNRGLMAHEIAFQLNRPRCFTIITDTAMKLVLNKGDIKHIMELINTGVDPNICTDTMCLTPLIYAISIADIESVRELIDAGGDVNLADKDGWSPLIFATFGGHLDIVKLLIKSGSNCYHINNVSHNAIQFAEARKYDDIIIELKKCLIENIKNNQQPNQQQQSQSQQEDVSNTEKNTYKSFTHNNVNNNDNINNIDDLYKQKHTKLILIPIILETGLFMLFLKFIYFLGFQHGTC